MNDRRRWVETGDGQVDALGDARRAQIVETTWRLIATIGLERTTMRQIAQEAGCTTGLVTHYFANKDEVLLAALHRITALSDERMRQGDQARGLARLRHLALAILPLDDARTMEWRVWLAFWGRAYSEPVLRREQSERYRQWRRAMRRAVREAVARNEITGPVDIEREVTHLVGLLIGLSVDAINLDSADHGGLMDVIDRHIETLAPKYDLGSLPR